MRIYICIIAASDSCICLLLPSLVITIIINDYCFIDYRANKISSMKSRAAPNTNGLPQTPAASPLSSSYVFPQEKLGYVRPWRTIVIVTPLFLLLNYICFSSIYRTEKENFWDVTPPYLSRLEQQSVKASQDRLWYGTPFSFLCFVLFYFEKIVSATARATSVVYRNKQILFQLCSVCWAIHCYEAGIGLQICRKCNASMLTTFKYLLGIIFGGLCQLFPLKAECKEYGKRERRRRERQRAARPAASAAM